MILRAASVAIAVALVAATPRLAGAADATEIAGYLDDDATAVVRADPDDLLDALAVARKVNPEVATTMLLLALGGRAIGIDMLSKSGWSDAGLDYDAPIFASLGALDMAAADKAYTTLATAATWNASTVRKVKKTWWRSRIAMGIKDAKRLEKTLKTLFDMAPFGVVWVAPENGEALAAMLGTRAKKRKAVVKALKKHKVLAVLAVPFTNQLGFVHRRGDVLVIDMVSTFSGLPIKWSKDKAAIIALLDRRPKSLAKRIAAGAGAIGTLADPGVAIWVDPDRLIDLSVAGNKAATLERVTGGGSLGTAPDYEAACAGYREIATTGPFTDAAATLTATKDGLRTEMVWGLRTAYKLAAAMVVHDDGLLAPQTTADAVIAGGLNMTGFGALRGLPRPSVLTGGAVTMWLRTMQCGPTALPMAVTFGWPQILGSLLDDVAGINGEADLVVSSARNVAFAAKKVGPSRDDNIGAIEVSFATKADDTFSHWNDQVFGATKQVTGKTRSYISWGRGKLRPYKWTTTDGQVVFGGGVGDQSVTWYLDRDVKAAGATSTIAWLELDAKKALRQLGGIVALFDAVRRQLGGAVSTISARMELRGDTLVSSIDFRL